jgi:DNA-binding SARP family transcriptional activator
MFSLRLLGGASLRDRNGSPLEGAATQRHRLALLALLATARSGSLTRDKLISFLWPDRDSATARHSLSVSLHVLRRALGEGALVSGGDEVSLNSQLVSVDARGFQAAQEEGRPEEAVRLYAGPLLDGFFLSDAPEFERWLEADGENA